jgi:hypothetical protein
MVVEGRREGRKDGRFLLNTKKERKDNHPSE